MKPGLIIAFGILLCACYVSSLPFTWRRIDPASGAPVPPARRHHAFGYLANLGLLVLYGGLGARGFLGDTWIYSLDDNIWLQLNGTGPPARGFMVYGVVQQLNWFVVATGEDSNVDYNDVWVLDFVALNNTMASISTNWRQLRIQGEAPEVRYGGHGGVYPGSGLSLWVGFGFNRVEETGKRLGDTFRITFTNTSTLNETYRWESLHKGVGLNQYHPFLPHARCLQAFAMSDDEELVFHGGCLRGGVGGGPCPAEDAWVLSNKDGDWKWTLLPHCATPRALGAMAPLTENRNTALLYGGDDRFDNGILEQIISGPRYPDNEVIIVNTITESWTRKVALPYSYFAADNSTVTEALPVRRMGHAMASGTSFNNTRLENNINMDVTDRQDIIFMFGGRDIYDPTLLNDLWMMTGRAANSEDLSGDCPAMWFSYLHLHGILLSVAWGLLFPTGVLVARYYRCGQSQTWLIVHVILQLTAVAMSSAGFVLVFLVSSKPNFPHAIIGIVLKMFALQQPINGFLRPHKSEGTKATRSRQCWELWHKSTGYFTVLAGLVNVSLGVFLIIPPLAVWIVWLCAILVWVVIFTIYEIIHLLKVCECTGQRSAKDTEMNTIYPGY